MFSISSISFCTHYLPLGLLVTMWQQRPEKIRVKMYLLIRLGHLNSQLFSITLLFKRYTVKIDKHLTKLVLFQVRKFTISTSDKDFSVNWTSVIHWICSVYFAPEKHTNKKLISADKYSHSSETEMLKTTCEISAAKSF